MPGSGGFPKGLAARLPAAKRRRIQRFATRLASGARTFIRAAPSIPGELEREREDYLKGSGATCVAVQGEYGSIRSPFVASKEAPYADGRSGDQRDLPRLGSDPP